MLFKQAAMILVREMPVLAAARVIEVSDTRLWRIAQLYLAQALSKKAVAVDETASKRGRDYVTVFIDLNRKQKPVIFATPGKGKGCLTLFCPSCVNMAAITTISPRWSTTYRQPSWPPSTMASPASTLSWTGPM
ncbi:hypothetical protein DFAR_1150018 [Desulfarculales bacterium]